MRAIATICVINAILLMLVGANLHVEHDMDFLLHAGGVFALAAIALAILSKGSDHG